MRTFSPRVQSEAAVILLGEDSDEICEESDNTTLGAAQSGTSRQPYIKMVFTSKDGLTTKDLSSDSAVYGNRILAIDHQEEAYNDYAYIVLNDTVAATLIPDLRGYWVEIGYGLITGAGNEYLGTQTSRLWVKHQRHVTEKGKLQVVLELEGMWSVARETQVQMGVAPYFSKQYPTGSSETVYQIMELILATIKPDGVIPFTLASAGTVDDGIIKTLIPTFAISDQPYEFAAGVLYRLIRLTKCYLRTRMGMNVEAVYPVSGDTGLATFYAITTLPTFKTYFERNPVIVPNSFAVYGNFTDTDKSAVVTGTAVSQVDIDAYREVLFAAVAPSVTTLAMLNNLAAAMRDRARMETDVGTLVIQHDARLELYDKVWVVDNRPDASVTYPTNNMTRICGLHHIYKPGVYDLEIFFGGVSNTGIDSFDADTRLLGTVRDTMSDIADTGLDKPTSSESINTSNPKEEMDRLMEKRAEEGRKNEEIQQRIRDSIIAKPREYYTPAVNVPGVPPTPKLTDAEIKEALKQTAMTMDEYIKGIQQTQTQQAIKQIGGLAGPQDIPKLKEALPPGHPLKTLNPNITTTMAEIQKISQTKLPPSRTNPIIKFFQRLFGVRM